MKEELLKSVAQPMQIFYAPFGLFMMNVAVSVVLMLLLLILNLGVYIWVSIVSFVVLHFLCVLIGKREPHIDNIIASRTNIRAHTKNLLRESGNKFTT